MAAGLSLRGALAAACLVLVAGCGDAPTSPDAAPATAQASSPSSSPPPSAEPADPVEAVKPEPLRRGETRMALRIPKSYTPSAPNQVGTDDYRCFLLDPHLTRPAYLTGTYVKPDNRNVVHHVILYRADPDQIGAAKALDARDPGRAGPASATVVCPTAATSTTRRGSGRGRPVPPRRSTRRGTACRSRPAPRS